jgi:hypothetical protein
MLYKTIDPSKDYNLDIPSSVLLPEFSKGFDKNVLHKQASCFENFYDKFERKPKHSYIHLISVAAGDFYGPNSRSDFYNGDSYKHVFPHPENNKKTFVILDGGIKKYHSTFDEHGKCYTEHVNRCHNAEPQGYIVASAYNEPMKRGELIIGVETEKWADDIENLANGKPMKFSIAMAAPHDICSICGREAHTEDEHCEHYKKMPGAVLEDGNVVYVISDKGIYHDISRVKVPAERIAFSLKKIASANDTLVNLSPKQIDPKALRMFMKSATADSKLITLEKLAKIEKRIKAIGDKLISKEALNAFKLRKQASVDSVENLSKFLDYANDKEVLGCLKKEKCVLSPEAFVKTFAPALFDVIDFDTEFSCGLPFNKLLSSTDVDIICNDDTYDEGTCYDLRLLGELPKLKETCSMSDKDVTDYIIGQSCCDSTPKITITVDNYENMSPLLKEYLTYFISACTGLDDKELTSALLQMSVK